MNIIRRILSTQYEPKLLVKQYIESVDLHSNKILPKDYYEKMKQATRKVQNPQLVLYHLLQHSKYLVSSVQVAKFLILINTFVRKIGNYDQQIIRRLEDMKFPQGMDETDWFRDFLKCYWMHLSRLPILSDALGICREKWNREWHLTILFRITNHLSPLFPIMGSALSTAARYKVPNHQIFTQLFQQISLELIDFYEIYRFLIQEVTQNYKLYQTSELTTFIRGLKEIDITCDYLQDFIMSKYIKGTKLKGKISIKDEWLIEVHYYLHTKQKNALQTSYNSYNQVSKGHHKSINNTCQKTQVETTASGQTTANCEITTVFKSKIPKAQQQSTFH